MRLRRFLLGLVVCCSVLGACGGDDDDSGSSASGASLASCNRQCVAQEEVRGTGCDPFVDLTTCKAICAQLVKGAKECGTEFNAYYDCSAADGFKCAGSLVTNKSSACDDELSALDRCSNGGAGKGGSCKGANDNGTCPQVACPCPEGTKMVSGFDTSSGSCACLDSDTCKDLFCD
jgi:hypothetical protein